MKNRFMIFVLLFAVLVALVPASEVRAETTEETKVIPAGTYVFNESIVSWELINNYRYWYISNIYFTDYTSSRIYFIMVDTEDEDFAVYNSTSDMTNYHEHTNGVSVSYRDGGWCVGTGICYGREECVQRKVTLTADLTVESNFYEWFKLNVDDIEGLLNYNFGSWCSDAGLSCQASSNETDDTYSFELNETDYLYLVRKNCVSGSDYTWYLSAINKESDHIFYSTSRAMSDNLIGAYNPALDSGTADYSSSTVQVKNYVYDSAGGGWLFTDYVGTDLGFTNPFYMDDIGISYSSTMPIVYSGIDIYSDKEQSSVTYASSTEFIDYEVVSPTPSPTPAITGGTAAATNALTPVYSQADISSEILEYLSAAKKIYLFGVITGETSARSFYHIKYYDDSGAIQEGYILTQYVSSSSGGTGSVDTTIGGDAEPGSGLDFIITLFSMIWSRICSIPMTVDGYSISIQQIVVYGLLVSIVGGFILTFIFGRRR